MPLKFSSKLLLCLLFLANSAFALSVPRLSGPVVDNANIMSSTNKRKLTAALKSLNSKSGIQIQVLTLKTLEGEPIENYSIKVVEQWKLGGAKNDRGALLLIAINDRKMRIEVGDGLEGEVTDLHSRRIINSMKPFFKNGDYDTGIYVGVASIAQASGVELGSVRLSRSSRGRRKSKYSMYFNLASFIIFFVLFGFRRRRSGFAYYGGGGGFSSGDGFGGGGGGGWSGGGGSFSGGGSSGSW